MIDDSNYKIYSIPFPSTVKALVAMDENSFYSIYVNSNLSVEAQKEAVMHELRHIERDDFYNGESIWDIEK